MSTQQPEALAQECADYATSLRSAANVAKLEGRAPPVSFLRAADLFERAASRITELESQLAQRFDAADMATAAAQGFRDGVVSVSTGSASMASYAARLLAAAALITQAKADEALRFAEVLTAAHGPADGESNV